MAYTILSASSIEHLMQQVNTAIRKGWIPQGGVSLAHDGGNSMNIIYVQAMTVVL